MGSISGLAGSVSGQASPVLNGGIPGQLIFSAPGPNGKDGRGVTSITGNTDGSWTITYTDGTTEPVSNEAYIALRDTLKAGTIEASEYHLGFYLDADGDLCQKED